jgi:hypothetical protein
MQPIILDLDGNPDKNCEVVYVLKLLNPRAKKVVGKKKWFNMFVKRKQGSFKMRCKERLKIVLFLGELSK